MAYTVVSHGPISADYASRFVATFREYPPGIETDVLIICNGDNRPFPTELSMIFSILNAKFFPRINDGGKDVTGYMDAARGPCASYDCVLWCGESIYFTREGWLRRFEEARQKHGNGLYGTFGSHNARPHLQTSAFFCSPEILRQYPIRPLTHAARFEWEHGERAMWRRVADRGMPVMMVTWDGEYPPRQWRMPQNILWRGDQSNLLMMNNHAVAWENANAMTKRNWSAKADVPFQ